MGSDIKFLGQEFNDIMGRTSYYKTVQNHVSEILKQIKPVYVLEFGSGSGASLGRFAKENPQASFVGIEFDKDLVEYSKSNKELTKITNATFINGDFNNLSTLNLINVDAIILIYSYNYISDPLENKRKFLEGVYNRVTKGTKIIIADWFLSDTKTFNENKIKEIYNLRIEEGIKSIKWSTLDEMTEGGLDLCDKSVEMYSKYHKKMLKKIVDRNEMYPTSKQWLIDTAVEIGFSVELEDFVNNTNDAVVVFRK